MQTLYPRRDAIFCISGVLDAEPFNQYPYTAEFSLTRICSQGISLDDR